MNQFTPPPPPTLEDVVHELRQLNDRMYLLNSYVEAQFEASKSQQDLHNERLAKIDKTNEELKWLNQNVGTLVKHAETERLHRKAKSDQRRTAIKVQGIIGGMLLFISIFVFVFINASIVPALFTIAFGVVVWQAVFSPD